MRNFIFSTFLGCVLLSFSLTGQAWGAMGEITSFSFQAAQEDILGMEESLEPDGKPDVHFSISIKGIGAITEVSLRVADGSREWDTIPGNAKWGMVVKDSTDRTITADTGMPIVPFLGFANLNIYVPDDGTVFSDTREYQVSVRFIDGSEISAKTRVEGMPQIFAPSGTVQLQQDGKIPGNMETFLYGPGSMDIAGKNETIGGDGISDAHFRVMFSTISVVDQITIRNVNGTNAMWDTVPGNGIWAVGVLVDGNLKNRSDGSVLFAVEGDTTLDLLVADNGAVSAGNTEFEVIVRFNDGTTLREIAVPGEGTGIQDEEGFIHAILFAPGTADLAGPGETIGGDGIPDWNVSLRLSGQGTIISLIVRGMDGSPGEWDTLPGNSKPVAVAADASGSVLNSTSGSVSIPLSGTTDLTLWLADNGYLAQTANRYRVIAVFSDGRTFERTIERGTDPIPLQTQPLAAPAAVPVQGSDSIRAFYMGKGPRNILGKGEPADIRTGIDLNPDAHIRLRLLLLDGTIQSLEVGSIGGNGGDWDTVPANGKWHIAVTETATGPVISRTDGSFTKTVSGNSELHLWLADDGKLAADPSGYRVIVRLADGRALSQNLF